MKKKLPILAAAILVAFGHSHSAQAQTNKVSAEEVTLAAEIAKLDLERPQNDFTNNLAHGDLRFIGIYGYTLDCPGTTTNDAKVIRTHGIRAIKGTSDFIRSKSHGDMIEKARCYADAYNRLLLASLEELDKRKESP